MNDAVRLVVLNLGFAAVGAAAVLLSGIPLERRWLPTVAGLAPIVGIAACGLLAFAGAMVGIDVSPASVTALALVGLLVGTIAARRWRPGAQWLAASRQGRLAWALEIAFLAVLALLSVRVVALAAATGLDAWDGWAIWAPKAHALFVQGDVWSPLFREPAYLMQHEEYPVLFPAIEALSAGAIGRFDPRLIDVEPAIVLVAFGWGAWATLRTVVPPAVAAAVALVLTTSGQLIENVTVNYADSVVAVFTALGLLCLLTWLSSDSSAHAVLACLLLAAAASTKAEGLLFSIAAIVAAGLVARGIGKPIRSVAALGAGVLAVPLMWMVVDRLNGPGAKNIDRGVLTEPGRAVDAAGRIPTAASRLLGEIVHGWHLAALMVAAAVGAALLARLWWSAVFVLLWGVLSFAALVGVYFASTAPVDWLLLTSADRVVFSIILGLATVSPMLAFQAWARTAEHRGRGGPEH